ncbi:DeoR/GlpR family DNA-binding transcription regulator [Petroclostridium sp. X23]|uniref:DeoR/GlpR family DNA-binding transcription regulator n=1 Tax=Petroclostridium sp. X23 TaxID=3045146 RepID=UPI0024ADCDF4|nr:DeoR/GlpR family DNA-binding transcription regulator [Petroclostridium sp. X23]WHH56975.1 DeoR/GlpR family DNA-binding transcription regulator [Petroclostridium sp. X23]
MLAVNRQDRILKLLDEKGFVKVSELSRLFDVAEETIRRDMEKLERQGLLQKIHGGATLVSEINEVPPMSQRKEINMDSKKRIAEAAIKDISSGDSIILDSGTTTLMLAHLLPDIDISVITNDINIAYELSNRERINLILTGGTQRKGSYSLVGPETERFFDMYNVQKLFLSTSGIQLEQGLSVSNTLEAHIKKRIISSAQEIICLADHTKFERSALVTFASINCLNKLISDEMVDKKYQQYFEEEGIELIIAKDMK